MTTRPSNEPNTHSDAADAERSGQPESPKQPDSLEPVMRAAPGTRWKGRPTYGSGPITVEERLARTNPEELSRLPTRDQMFLTQLRYACREIKSRKGISLLRPDGKYMAVQRMALMEQLTCTDPKIVVQAAGLLQKLDERIEQRAKGGSKEKTTPTKTPKAEKDDGMEAARKAMDELGLG